MKKKAIGIAAVLLALAAGFFVYTIWNARTEASAAVDAYNAAARDYNEAIAPYNEAAAGIADANGELRAALDSAQEILDQGGEAYDPDTREKLESAVQEAETAFVEVPVQIDPFVMREVPVSFSTDQLALAQHEAETALTAVEEALEKIPAVPEVPDFSGELEAVRSAQKNYEDSVQKLANIMSPSDTFVKERLERVGTIVQAEAVTAENDPNGLLGKEGGYLGCVYFLDDRIDRSLLPQEAFSKESTDAAAENAEDAEKSENGAGEEEASVSAAQEEAAKDVTASSAEITAASKTDNAAPSAAESTSSSASEGNASSSADSTAAETAAEEAAESAAGSTTAAAAETAAAVQESAPQKEKAADVLMIGTVGGGAVEIYSTREEAEKRAEYISFFEGSVMEAGSCAIEGTCLIRVSKYLDDEQQETLTQEIREALLTVDE